MGELNFNPISSHTVDTMLAELLDLEADVKAKTKRIDEIRTWCKKQGSFCTTKYVCSVKDVTRTGMAPLEKAIKAFGREMLEQFELISVSTYKIISVSRKLNNNFKEF